MAIPTISDSIRLTLPLPPSVNQQYVMRQGRRVLSAEARRYKSAALRRIEALRRDGAIPEALLQRFREAHWGIYVEFYFETPTRRDLDNGFKIAQDVVAEGLGLNDNRVVDIHLSKRLDPLRPRIEVVVEAIIDWQFDAEYEVLLGPPASTETEAG